MIRHISRHISSASLPSFSFTFQTENLLFKTFKTCRINMSQSINGI